MSSNPLLPDVPIQVLPEDFDDEGFENDTLRNFLKGKAGIIDLWHTKCTRCPAALEKLNIDAQKLKKETEKDVIFLSLALSQGEGDIDMVKELTEDWQDMRHVFTAQSDKEKMRGVFGFKAVPFYVVFNAEGSIIQMGDGKAINAVEVLCGFLSSTAAATASLEASSVVDQVTKALDNTTIESVAALAAATSDTTSATTQGQFVFQLDEDF